MRTAKLLIRQAGCPSWSESSLGAQSFCLFCHMIKMQWISWYAYMDAEFVPVGPDNTVSWVSPSSGKVTSLNACRAIPQLQKTVLALHTPGIYAEGYIVFVFLFVCSSVHMFVCSYFRPVRGITSKLYVQATRVEYISPTTHQKAFIFGP